MTRYGVFGSAAAGVSYVAILACVTPRSDYEDFMSRTADVRGKDPTAVAQGTFDGSAPDAGFSGTYAMTCLPVLVAGRVDRALRFVATVNYAGSNITVELQGMDKTATNLSGAIGNKYTSTAAVSSDAKFTWDFGAPTFPKEFNTIRDEAVEFGHALIDGLLVTPDKFCGELRGDIVKPSPLNLNDTTTDYCLIERVAGPTAAFPEYVREDFGCPPPTSAPADGGTPADADAGAQPD